MNHTVSEYPGHITVAIIHRAPLEMSSASADRIKDDAWWIPRVFVHPKHRGQGVGSSLLQELVKRCLEQGPDRIEVAPGGYESDPERQRNFYTKNGFVELLEDPGMFIYQNHEVP